MASGGTTDDLVCAICRNIFKNPQLLPCLHTFCYDCIIKRTPDCFICHAAFSPSNGNISALKTNTYIASLVDLHTLKTDPAMCIVCQFRGLQESATHYCVDCGDMLCSTCSAHHTFTRLTFDHQVVNCTDVQGGKYDDVILQKRLLTCGEHPDTQLKYFCMSCSSPVCEQCLVKHRKDHEVITKQEALESSKAKDIDRMCAELRPRIRQAITVQQFVKNGIEEIEMKEKEIPRKIQSLCDKLKNVVDKKGKEAKQMASLELSEIKQKLTTHKSEVDIYLETLEPSLQLCDTLISGVNTSHILPIEDILLKKLLSLTTMDRPSDNVERQTLNVEFQNSLQDAIYIATLTRTDVRLTNEGSVIESASLPVKHGIQPRVNQGTSQGQEIPILANCSAQSQDVITKPKFAGKEKTQSNTSKDANNKQVRLGSSVAEDKTKLLHSGNVTSKQTSAVKVKKSTPTVGNNLNQPKVGNEETVPSFSKRKRSASGPPTVNKYQLVRCFSLETLSDTLKPAVTSVAWVNSNSFVVSDMDNNKVSVFNTDGTVEWSAPIDGPYNVACVKGVIACSGKCYITLFKNKKQLKNIKMNSSNITPLLTRTVDETFLGTTSYARNSMETFTTSGESRTPIRTERCSVNMISSNDEWHIVSDWSMNSLVFIDKTTGRIVKETMLPEPRQWGGHHGGHCTDDNSVLVADYHGHKVIVLSKDGKYLHSWSLPSAIYHPVDLDFHSSGQLVVTCKHRVAIFTKKHNF